MSIMDMLFCLLSDKLFKYIDFKEETMQNPNSIVLVRHGESEGNVVSAEDISFADKANHRFSLTEKGREQARRAGEVLRKDGRVFDAYFVSTFLRTQQTMSLMFPNVTPIIDSRLNELWRGIWHTMSPVQVEEFYPEEKAIKARDGWFHYMPPAGQACQDVELMIHSLLLYFSLFYSGKNILIAGHGNWMILLDRILYNRSTSHAGHRYHNRKYENGSITIHRGGVGMTWVNEVDNFVPE